MGARVAVPPATDQRWIFLALVFGAITFNMGLCFANTDFMGVSNIHVIAFEVLIISLAFLDAYPAIAHPFDPDGEHRALDADAGLLRVMIGTDDSSTSRSCAT